MKRALSLVLALLLVVSLAACGKPAGEKPGPSPSGSEPPAQSSTQPPETPSAAPSEEPSQEPEPSAEPSEEPEPSEVPEPSEEPPQTPEPSSEPSEAPADPGFDNSWASNEFEALLPQLPFDGWTTAQKSDREYELELGGLDTTNYTDENGKTIGYGVDKAALIDYLNTLPTYGFTVEETGGIEGYEYEWMVTDSNGNEIEFVCAEGYCWITITMSAPAASAPAPDGSWTTHPVAQKLPEPPATYTVAEKQSSDTFCLIEITCATFNEIVDYGAMLRDSGFSIDVQESSDETADGRLLYNYKAKNADGCSVSLSFSTMEGDYTVTYVEVYTN